VSLEGFAKSLSEVKVPDVGMNLVSDFWTADRKKRAGSAFSRQKLR